MGNDQELTLPTMAADGPRAQRAGKRNLAGFDFRQRNREFMEGGQGEPFNNAVDYGVQIAPADCAPEQSYWKVIGVYHLAPRENGRRHNAFIEALDESGARIQNPLVRVGWIWEGKSDGPADPKRLDKPLNEPAADIPLEKTMTVTLWLDGDGPSDQVTGLHTRHADESDGEGSGNTWGHHSYYLVFQRARKQTLPVKPIEDGATTLTKVSENGGSSDDSVTDMDVSVDETTTHEEIGAPLIDDATYVPDSDVVKDGTTLPPGLPFAQSWEFRNSGTTTWGVGYKLVWVAGENLGAPEALPTPACVPGQSVRLVVPFITPPQPGAYTSTWRLHNTANQPFGQRVWTQISVAATPAGRAIPLDDETNARSPLPPSPQPGKSLLEADPELYAAWREHMRRGFENNQTMFEQVLTGFMNPYWTTVWMYRILFGVGVAAFVVAAGMAIMGQGALSTAIFGGLSVAAFLTYFLNRPLQALEENLQFITWLGVIYNSYWTRLAYTMDLATVQQEVEATTNDTIAKIKELMDKHVERNKDRPGLGQ